MEKHVFYHNNESGFEVVKCCELAPDDPIHVPQSVGALKHGDRVYFRQIFTHEAVNSILERIDSLEDDCACDMMQRLSGHRVGCRNA